MIATLERRGADRRGPARLLSRYTVLGGRRLAARRAAQRRGYVADSHGTLLFLAVVAIAALNILDAHYTVLFLSYGGTELNPIVDWLLRHGGVWPFLLAKTLGIGLCVGFLTLTKGYLIARIGLGLVLAGYTALLGWHVYLSFHVPP